MTTDEFSPDLNVVYRIIPGTEDITSEWSTPTGVALPKVIFHATHKDNLEEIIQGSIHPGWDGLIYCADSPANAAMFLALRMPATDIIAFAIPTDDIDLARFDVGRDHAPGFWPGEVFTIRGSLDAECIEDTYEFFDSTKDES